MFFSLERDIALSIGKVSEKDDLSEITIQRENALKDLELETAKLVRRLLKETLRCLLHLSSCSSPQRLCIGLASVTTEITAAWESSVAMKHWAWGQDPGSVPDTPCWTRVHYFFNLTHSSLHITYVALVREKVESRICLSP